MITYLADCMAIAVQTAIGALIWTGIVFGLLVVGAVVMALLSRNPPNPNRWAKSCKGWDIEDVEVIDGGKDDRENEGSI